MVIRSLQAKINTMIYVKRTLILFLTIFLFSIHSAEISESQMKLLENLPPDQRDSLMSKMETQAELEEEIDSSIQEEMLLIERPDLTRADLEVEKCTS